MLLHPLRQMLASAPPVRPHQMLLTSRLHRRPRRRRPPLDRRRPLLLPPKAAGCRLAAAMEYAGRSPKHRSRMPLRKRNPAQASKQADQKRSNDRAAEWLSLAHASFCSWLRAGQKLSFLPLQGTCIRAHGIALQMLHSPISCSADPSCRRLNPAADPSAARPAHCYPESSNHSQSAKPAQQPRIVLP